MPEWFVFYKGQEHGPISSQQLKKLAAAGKIAPTTQVRPDNRDKWSLANKVNGLEFAHSIPKQQLMPAAPVDTTPLDQRMRCPFCSEQISVAAIKCRHCGEFLNGSNPSSRAQPTAAAAQTIVNVVQHAQTQPRWSPGVAAMLSLLVPGMGQLYKGQIFNGLLWFVLTVVGYVAFIIPGLILHVCCVIGAATGNPYR